ncbi:MAG: glycerophosphodiester phosphodiesterase [Actinomycetota bacterium]|nr:glycerophosphodiester phosphodiesterase [Actinomycetota bacterium]
MSSRFRFLDAPTPVALAHRGGAKENPENTWAAFSHAVEDLDYRYVETDVHSTADGVVAISHDPTLDRTTDRSGAIVELRWADVARARIAGDQAVPRLDEVLAAWPDIRWNIDAKHDAVVGPLARVICRAGAIERVCVTSFSDRRLVRVRRALGPEVCTAMGPVAIAALRATGFTRRTLLAGAWAQPAGAAQVPMSHGRISVVDPRFIATAHRLGLAVHVWTVNDAATMERVVDLGVDGIMTDQPTLLRTILERRGLWRQT